MKKVLIVVGVLLLAGVAFFAGSVMMQNKHHAQNRMKSPEEIKRDLKQKEQRTPVKYLKATATLRNTIKGALSFKGNNRQKFIDGTISNSATMAVFKDPVIELKYYSRTKTLIDTKNYVIYQVVNPGQTIKFEYKIDAPKAMESFDISIKRGTAVY